MHNNHAKALISEWNDISVDELEILGIKKTCQQILSIYKDSLTRCLDLLDY